MNLNFHISFNTEDKWLLNEDFTSIVEAHEVAENISRLTYKSGVELMHISLPDNTWHIYCNRPLELVKATDEHDLSNRIEYYVMVIH